ncbi:tRNA adenosine(34) deaminase TadA [Silvibacterium dinghuense]|uniref:tRNA-specific adenosine deaminase n=1 Tax=Silvibacterium dinghuense TaxID=1560006 RepID=A0A4Q1S8Z2_9BACT|nr:tRNA adenosine(34) deaminase TadA [Silvibacterium dinghuense]RXS93452.1 tRNA adenosine(34) deaminase TadA [Silvibacterium dinghuense]
MTPEEVWMREAMAEAKAAADAGEVPVGAIIVFEGEIIGRGQNRVLRDLDPTAHAEVIALREAARHRSNYRLTDCDLYTTLEPCSMCAGAIIHARIRRVAFAADDPKAGAAGSVLEVLNHPKLNHQLEISRGVMGIEAGEMLRQFFRDRRTAAQG